MRQAGLRLPEWYGALASLAISPSQCFRLGARLQRRAVAAHLLAQPDGLETRVAGARLEAGSALGQRQPAQVVVSVAQDIEQDQRDRLRGLAARDVGFLGEVDASLQPLEAGRPSLVVEGDNLAVEEERGAQPGRRLAQGAARSTGTGRSSRCRAGTRCGPRPRRLPGVTSTRARMPSYLGS